MPVDSNSTVPFGSIFCQNTMQQSPSFGSQPQPQLSQNLFNKPPPSQPTQSLFGIQPPNLFGGIQTQTMQTQSLFSSAPTQSLTSTQQPLSQQAQSLFGPISNQAGLIQPSQTGVNVNGGGLFKIGK